MLQLTFNTQTQQVSTADLSTAIDAAVGRHINFSVNGNTVTVVDQVSATEQTAIETAFNAHIVIDWALRNAINEGLDIIDDEAEVTRAKYLTDYPLQAATYINKAKDALSYKTMGYPLPFVAASFPYVDAEMRAAGDTTAQAAADRILTEASMYDSVKGAGIEYARRLAKINIGNATTVAAAQAATATGLVNLRAL